MLLPRLRARFAVAFAAALLLTTLAPMAPAQVAGPIKVRASELTHPVDGMHDFALPADTTHIAIHWPGAPDAQVMAAFSEDGATFSEPIHVEVDDIGPEPQDEHSFGPVMTVTGIRTVRVTSDRPLPEVTVLALDAAGGETLQLDLGTDAAASSAIPTVIPRSGWGADESLRFNAAGEEIWTREYYPIQKLVVHHTAGANSDPNPAATVRAIYYYHAITRTWGDIGYNYLVDEAGRVYEGRYSRPYPAGVMPTSDNEAGLGVEGGHALRHNPGTFGLSFLGTFETRAPTLAARRSMVRMLAWASAKHGVNPRAASTYVNPVSGVTRATMNIAGHRDYQSTACPGAVLNGLLPAMRNDVAAELVELFGGTDRFGTAALISSRFFSSASTVLVANGMDFADALAGGPAAAELDAPLLLTWPDRLAATTRAEIQRLAPDEIFVLGGPASVSDAVFNELTALAPGGAVRVGGADRYETATLISSRFFPAAATVLIASGSNFPDALAGGPAAAHLGAPLLLVSPNSIPDAVRVELARLDPSQIMVLGGPAAVSEAVRAELGTLAGGGAVRLGGADRYATAAVIASAVFPTATSVMLANGLNFPDALAGGPAAARLRGPLLLVRPTSIPAATSSELRRMGPMWVPVLGGTGVVVDGVLAEVRGVLGIP